MWARCGQDGQFHSRGWIRPILPWEHDWPKNYFMSTFCHHCININYCRRIIRWATSVSWMNTTDSALGARPAKLSSRRSVFIQALYHHCLITTSKHLKGCEKSCSSNSIFSITSSYLLFTHFHHSWHWIPHIIVLFARIMISISGIVHIFTSGAVVTLIKEVFFCNYANLFYSPPSLIFIKVGAKKTERGFLLVFIFPHSSTSEHSFYSLAGTGADVFTAIIPIYDPYSRRFNFYLHFESTRRQWEPESPLYPDWPTRRCNHHFPQTL